MIESITVAAAASSMRSLGHSILPLPTCLKVSRSSIEQYEHVSVDYSVVFEVRINIAMEILECIRVRTLPPS